MLLDEDEDEDEEEVNSCSCSIFRDPCFFRSQPERITESGFGGLTVDMFLKRGMVSPGRNRFDHEWVYGGKDWCSRCELKGIVVEIV